MNNDSSKLHKRRNQPVVSHNKRNVLLTRFNIKSLFQRGNLQRGKKGKEGQDIPYIKAVIEQVGFFGCQLRCEVLLPGDSDLWGELPLEREDSENAYQ